MKLNTTGKQLFIIREDGLMDDYEVQVAIDFDFPEVREKIKDMSMFWSGHPEESEPFEEHLDFLLRLIATDVFYLKNGERFNDYGVAKEFAEREGYYPLDGTQGILVRTSCFPEVGIDSFRIAEQEVYTGMFEISRPEW